MVPVPVVGGRGSVLDAEHAWVVWRCGGSGSGGGGGGGGSGGGVESGERENDRANTFFLPHLKAGFLTRRSFDRLPFVSEHSVD